MAKTLQNAVPPYYRLRANDHADGKNRVFSKSEHFFINGERGGPLATYLVSASERGNFKLIMNSTVTRVVRQGDTITGVEIESSGPDGYLGVVGVKNGTGRVVLSAGVWGTSKILFRSTSLPFSFHIYAVEQLIFAQAELGRMTNSPF